MTVSNVLNAPHRVSPPTVQTVRAAIDELGYIPNHAARALSSGRSQVIGLPLYLEDDAFAEQNPGLGGFLHGLLGGLVKAAALSGYGVHVTTPTEGATEIALYEKLIAARQVDAIVVLETMPHDDRIEFLSSGDSRSSRSDGPGRSTDSAGSTWTTRPRWPVSRGICNRPDASGRCTWRRTVPCRGCINDSTASSASSRPRSCARSGRSTPSRRTSRRRRRRTCSSRTTTPLPWWRSGRCNDVGSQSGRTSRSPGSTIFRSRACWTPR